jgi:hypothetical protein
VERYGRARQAIDGDNGMCCAYWISKAEDTHSKYLILAAFPQESQYYIYTYFASCVILVIKQI